MIRSRKITESSRGKPCTMFAPGCNGGGGDDVCFCHSNMQVHGKGRSIKAHDVFGFDGCGPCHWWYDKGPASREEKEAYLLTAMARTQLRLFEEGLLVAA
jgi:hypothetical protein